MRYAVISDIHANLEALLAVLDRIAGLGVDEVLCLGDIVGYNADPNACVEIVRSGGFHSVLGNHDERAAGLSEPHDFNAVAAQAVLWTREQLTEENRAWLAALPREKRIGDLLIVHGSIGDTDRYILRAADVVDTFRLLAEIPGCDLVFFGHTHVRASFVRIGASAAIDRKDVLRREEGRPLLVNPGSVGQPRDRDPRASFAVYDTEDRTIVFHRVDYDLRICRDKVLRAGLPPRLAERLALGM